MTHVEVVNERTRQEALRDEERMERELPDPEFSTTWAIGLSVGVLLPWLIGFHSIWNWIAETFF